MAIPAQALFSILASLVVMTVFSVAINSLMTSEYRTIDIFGYHMTFNETRIPHSSPVGLECESHNVKSGINIVSQSRCGSHSIGINTNDPQCDMDVVGDVCISGDITLSSGSVINGHTPQEIQEVIDEFIERYDLNMNGECDDFEDYNGDGVCDGQDVLVRDSASCDLVTCTGSPCQLINCIHGICQLTGYVQSCCEVNGECNDGNPCTLDTCTNNMCTHVQQGCSRDYECNSNELCIECQCTDDIDQDWCVTSNDCDDNILCTLDTCDQNNICIYTPLPRCCTSDDDCIDFTNENSSITNFCDVTTDMCSFNDVDLDGDEVYASDDCDDNDPDNTNTSSIIYRDEDSDGFGTNLNKLKDCAPFTVGYSLVGGDCVDSDQCIYPNQTRFCNGLDNDCDGTTDTSGSAVDCISTKSNFDSTEDSSGYSDSACMSFVLEVLNGKPTIVYYTRAISSTPSTPEDAVIYIGRPTTNNGPSGADWTNDKIQTGVEDNPNFLSEAYAYINQNNGFSENVSDPSVSITMKHDNVGAIVTYPNFTDGDIYLFNISDIGALGSVGDPQSLIPGLGIGTLPDSKILAVYSGIGKYLYIFITFSGGIYTARFIYADLDLNWDIGTTSFDNADTVDVNGLDAVFHTSTNKTSVILTYESQGGDNKIVVFTQKTGNTLMASNPGTSDYDINTLLQTDEDIHPNFALGYTAGGLPIIAFGMKNGTSMYNLYVLVAETTNFQGDWNLQTVDDSGYTRIYPSIANVGNRVYIAYTTQEDSTSPTQLKLAKNCFEVPQEGNWIISTVATSPGVVRPDPNTAPGIYEGTDGKLHIAYQSGFFFKNYVISP